MTDKPEPTNIVIVAGQDKDVYIRTIAYKMQRFDEITLRCKKGYVEKADWLCNFFLNCGLTPVKGYPLKYEETKQNVPNPKTGNVATEEVMEIVLRKHPDLYKFTNSPGAE